MIAQVVDRIHPGPPARTDIRILDKGDSQSRVPRCELSVLDDVIVDEPDKGLVAPLDPVKVFLAVGLKALAHAIPGLQFDILADAGGRPSSRAPRQYPHEAQHYTENNRFPHMCCPHSCTP